MIGLLFSTLIAVPVLPELKIVAPALGERCMGSPVQLGLDNAPPINSDIDTSIVNMWAFVMPSTHTALGWLYHNKRGEFYVHFSQRASGLLKRNPVTALLSAKGGHTLSIPAKVSVQQIFEIENILGGEGVVRVSCFSHALRTL